MVEDVLKQDLKSANDHWFLIENGALEAAGFLVNERVDIYNIDTGARFSTYVIEVPAGSGVIDLNGAAARLALTGDKVIIVAYANFDSNEARTFKPSVVFVDGKNRRVSSVRQPADVLLTT